MPDPNPYPTTDEEQKVATSDFGRALLQRLDLDPLETLVSGFRVEFHGDTALIHYRGLKRIPAADVHALMAEHPAPGETS